MNVKRLTDDQLDDIELAALRAQPSQSAKTPEELERLRQFIRAAERDPSLAQPPLTIKNDEDRERVDRLLRAAERAPTIEHELAERCAVDEAVTLSDGRTVIVTSGKGTLPDDTPIEVRATADEPLSIASRAKLIALLRRRSEARR